MDNPADQGSIAGKMDDRIVGKAAGEQGIVLGVLLFHEGRKRLSLPTRHLVSGSILHSF